MAGMCPNRFASLVFRIAETPNHAKRPLNGGGVEENPRRRKEETPTTSNKGKTGRVEKRSQPEVERTTETPEVSLEEHNTAAAPPSSEVDRRMEESQVPR